MMGTGGGSPKNLRLTTVENALIDFLTPDATGLSNIPEGGLENIISSNNPRQDLNYSPSCSPAQKGNILQEIVSKGDQYYSSLSPIEDDTNIDTFLSDYSEDFMLSSTSNQTKRMQSPVMDQEQSKVKQRKTLVLSDNNKQTISENKENIRVCIQLISMKTFYINNIVFLRCIFDMIE